MDFQDAIKALRKELDKTQVDIAKALHISVGTVSRWETGSNYPNRSVAVALLEYAKLHGASKECIERLKQSSKETVKRRQRQYQGELFSIEHSSLEELIECVTFPIYVCDMETDEILYLNKKARQMLSNEPNTGISKKCYECVMHRDAPCDFCHKAELKSDEFLTYDAFRPSDGTSYRVQGKLIRWNGHNAQIQCISNIGRTVEVSIQDERKQSYEEFLNIKSSTSKECIAMAHYNLTRNTVSGVMCNLDSIAYIMKNGKADELLDAVKQHIFDKEEQKRYAYISDRTTMKNMFYNGQTHISIRHHLSVDKRLYETTFDLLQNPTTFDIEAVVVLKTISDSSLAEEVTTALLGLDYETIVLIDAVTGEARPITKGRIDYVIKEQKELGNNVAGVEAYLRRYCFDTDVERAVFETSLPNVVKQLESKIKYSVSYSVKINEKVIHKRAIYTYFDSARSFILCAMQDITETYNDEIIRNKRLIAAVETVQYVCNVLVGRYDINEKVLYGSNEEFKRLGFGNSIPDFPETSIRNGLIAPASIDEYRGFYEKLCNGISNTVHVAVQSMDGNYRWFKLSGKVLEGDEGKPDQAIIVRQDVTEHREQTAVYRNWKRSLESRDPESFTLFRCNVSKDASFDTKEGSLLKINFDPALLSFNERTYEYSMKFVHPDDRKAYINFLNAEGLLKAYQNGMTSSSTNYRELLPDGDTRWIHLSVEMAKYPDCDDVEIFLLYEKA